MSAVRLCRATLAALTLFAVAHVHAGPADYVQVPYIDQGHWQLSVGAGRTLARAGSGETALVPSVGFSPTSSWFTAFYGEWSRPSDEPTRLEAWSWVNQVRLFAASAKLPFDLHLLVEIERPKDHRDGWGLTFGPMLQYDAAHWQANFNLLVSKSVHTVHDEPATLGYQWQAKALWRPGLDVGLQGLGSIGSLGGHVDGDRWHEAGPALFGHWPVGTGRTLRVDGALLVGLGDSSPSGTLRLQARLEF